MKEQQSLSSGVLIVDGAKWLELCGKLWKFWWATAEKLCKVLLGHLEENAVLNLCEVLQATDLCVKLWFLH